VLLTSLSRQLLVTSARMVDKIKASVLGEEMRDGKNGMPKLADAIAEMEALGLEDPTVAVAADSSVSKINSPHEEVPHLSGVEALVYHMDRLFELSSRHEKRINTVVSQVISRKSNRHFMKSDIFTNATYYLPHMDRECKSVDRKVLSELTADLERTTVPQAEIYERLISHLNERLMTSQDAPNPLGIELNNAVQSGKKFITEHATMIMEHPTELSQTDFKANSSSNGGNTQQQTQQHQHADDDFVIMGQQKYFDTLKADIDQYADLLTVGIQLSFESVVTQSGGEKLGDLSRIGVKELVVAHLYPALMNLFRSMNDRKDAAWTSHCRQLKQVANATLMGLSDDFWQVVTAPNALNDFFPICEHFINADSVRMKYEYLQQMSVCTQTIASTGLKRIAAQAGKPFDPSKHGDNLRFAVGADDFVPLFAYMLLQSNIPDIHAQFAFLNVFTEESALIGRYGYLLASLQTGMMVVSGTSAAPVTVSSPSIPIETFTLIEESPSSRSSFIRTSISTSNLAGADPLSRDDWDSEGNTSGEESPKSLGTPPHSLKHMISKAITRIGRFKEEFGVSSSSSSKKRDRSPGGADVVDGEDSHSSSTPASGFSSPSSASAASSGNFSSNTYSALSESPTLIRSGSSVLREQQMPNIEILNNPAPFPPLSALQGDHAYSLSLKVFTLMLCLYQRYENRVLIQGHAISSPTANAKNDEIMKNYREEICHLHRVRLSSLNDPQKLVFFTNIYHALLMHAFIEKEVPDSLRDRVEIMASSAYMIGDVSFSILEIEHGILRHWSPYPQELLDGMFHFPAKWKTSDWSKSVHAPKRAEPRLNFILSQFTTSGPPLRIITTETIEHVLQMATEEYLRRNVLVSSDQSVIILPKLLFWYSREFGRRDKNLIDWVSRYLEPAQQEILMRANRDSLRLKYNEYDWTFVFSFENLPDA